MIMKRKDMVFIIGLVLIVSAWFLYSRSFSSTTPEARGIIGQSLIWLILGWIGIYFGVTGILKRKANPSGSKAKQKR